MSPFQLGFWCLLVLAAAALGFLVGIAESDHLQRLKDHHAAKDKN